MDMLRECTYSVPSLSSPSKSPPLIIDILLKRRSLSAKWKINTKHKTVQSILLEHNEALKISK